jgi:phosphatidylglycerophosphate synthase
MVMPEQIHPSPSPVEATFKTREVEGIVDLYFYRKIGFRLAQFFAKLGMTPTMVTLLGGVVGITAGHLYFYRDLYLNIVGMVLHICANLLDNADGQLARLLNQKSKTGRIIDSLVDHLIFLNIYVHLALRCFVEGASPAIGLLALAAGISHALQGAAADYFRNAYLYFARGQSRADWDSVATLQRDYRNLSWRREAWNKFLLMTYLNFTRQQEMLSPNLRQLRNATVGEFSDEVPASLRKSYRDIALPMLRWWGLLMTNTRMFFLFLFIIIDRPAWYFWLELSVLNGLLIYLILRQERMARSFLVQPYQSAEVTARSL